MKKLAVSLLLCGTICLSGCGVDVIELLGKPMTKECNCSCENNTDKSYAEEPQDTDSESTQEVEQDYSNIPHDTVGTIVCDCIAYTEILEYGGIANLTLNDVWTEPYELVQNGLAVYLHLTMDLYAGVGITFDYNNFILMREDEEIYYLPAYTSKIEFRQDNRNQSSKVHVKPDHTYFDKGDFDPENGTKQDFVLRFVIPDKLFVDDKLPNFKLVFKDPTTGGRRDDITVHLEH